MFLQSYKLKNYIKRQLAHVSEAIDFARYHPVATLRKEAHESSVAFIKDRCPYAIAFDCAEDLLLYALDLAKTSTGSFMEFGVYRGQSINVIADRIKPKLVYGFDSFEGLPDDWHSMPKEFFSLGGKLPTVRSNVKLIKGFYDQSLPQFFLDHKDKIAFAHIDCDVYVSTEAVLSSIESMIVDGTILLFDDYFNQPFWERDSHKAFEASLKRNDWGVEYIGYSFQEMLVRIRVESPATPELSSLPDVV